MAQDTYFRYDQIGSSPQVKDGPSGEKYTFFPHRATRVITKADKEHFRQNQHYTEVAGVFEDQAPSQDEDEDEQGSEETTQDDLEAKISDNETIASLREELDEAGVEYTTSEKKASLVSKVADLRAEE